MRQALAAGAFALLLAGSFANANAATTSRAKVSPTTTNDAVTSPDVAQWTSHLIVVTKSENGSNAQFRSFAGGVLARTSKLATQLTRSALRFLGVPYVFGGTSTSGFDCSGYVQHVFAMLGINLPRTADAQYDVGHRIRRGHAPGRSGVFPNVCIRCLTRRHLSRSRQVRAREFEPRRDGLQSA